MSYDARLEMDAGGVEPAVLDSLNVNYTSNCAVMLDAAIGIGPMDLSGPAGEAAAMIRRALAVMEADPDNYRAMEPDNGWGDYEGFAEWLAVIALACELAPKATLVVG